MGIAGRGCRKGILGRGYRKGILGRGYRMGIPGRRYPYSKLVSVRTSLKRIQFSFN